MLNLDWTVRESIGVVIVCVGLLFGLDFLGVR